MRFLEIPKENLEDFKKTEKVNYSVLSWLTGTRSAIPQPLLKQYTSAC